MQEMGKSRKVWVKRGIPLIKKELMSQECKEDQEDLRMKQYKADRRNQ